MAPNEGKDPEGIRLNLDLSPEEIRRAKKKGKKPKGSPPNIGSPLDWTDVPTRPAPPPVKQSEP